MYENYNGEEITSEYLSTTGGLDIGATIYYILDEPLNIQLKPININEMTPIHAMQTLSDMVQKAKNIT